MRPYITVAATRAHTKSVLFRWPSGVKVTVAMAPPRSGEKTVPRPVNLPSSNSPWKARKPSGQSTSWLTNRTRMRGMNILPWPWYRQRLK